LVNPRYVESTPSSPINSQDAGVLGPFERQKQFDLVLSKGIKLSAILIKKGLIAADVTVVLDNKGNLVLTSVLKVSTVLVVAKLGEMHPSVKNNVTRILLNI
jgi:hypothetical protein